ncbi:MAG: amidohydrolase, partial [Planctomycetaceae bacterium]|nr:amidohydrolase [Planctomycetaceae bacterium]
MSSLNRRTFLKTASAGFLASQLNLSESKAAASKPLLPAKVVDTHTHFYDPSRPEGVPWPSKGSSL